jgi:hypothetical protein
MSSISKGMTPMTSQYYIFYINIYYYWFLNMNEH